MAKGRIVIDQNGCKGCTLCTTACPQNVVSMAAEILNGRGYHPAQYTDTDGNCTGCALCAVICPEACITVYRYVKSPKAVLQPALA